MTLVKEQTGAALCLLGAFLNNRKTQLFMQQQQHVATLRKILQACEYVEKKIVRIFGPQGMPFYSCNTQ